MARPRTLELLHLSDAGRQLEDFFEECCRITQRWREASPLTVSLGWYTEEDLDQVDEPAVETLRCKGITLYFYDEEPSIRWMLVDVGRLVSSAMCSLQHTSEEADSFSLSFAELESTIDGRATCIREVPRNELKSVPFAFSVRM